MKKLIIRYIVALNRINPEGKTAIGCRITYAKQRKQFSTSQFVNPKNWNSKQQLVKPPEPDEEIINSHLSLIKTKINRAFLMLQIQEISFAVKDIYSLYKGEKSTREYSVIEYFERFLNKLKKLINIDIKHATWKKFEYVKKHVQSFIKWQYKSSDYPLKDLKQQFLNDFEFYLKTGKHIGQITINKIIQRFRKPIKAVYTTLIFSRSFRCLKKSLLNTYMKNIDNIIRAIQIAIVIIGGF